jgi:predicted  nucleic acid-binding Zn-ribbon protein
MINTYGKATMLAEIEQLLVVQDHDTNLKTLQNELQTLPFERDRLEQLIQDRTSALERVRLHSKETEVHRKKLELDAAARRDQIAKYKTQQFQTRKNEEFQAIGNEIGRLEREITQIEDQEIDLMEQGETAAREIQSAESSFKAEQAQIQQQLGSLKQKGEVLTKALEETKSARQKAAAAVSDQELLGRYERIFHSKGGSAVVSIEREVCMGCHMKNTTTNAHRAKLAREVVYCEYCGRMLY